MPQSAHANLSRVHVITPHLGAVTEQRELSGVIAPLQNITLSSTLAEPAASVNVVEGDRVAAGTVLAVFDTSDLDASLRADEANAENARAALVRQRADSRQAIGQGFDTLRSSRATLEQARTKLALDQRTLARDEQLLAQSYLPTQTVDTQRTTVLSDQAAVSSAQSALAQAELVVSTNGRLDTSTSNAPGIQAAAIAANQASLNAALAQADQIRAQISRAVLRAPVSSVVINRNLNPGEYPNSRTLFVLQQTGTVYAVLNCSPSQIRDLAVGESAQIYLNGNTDTIVYPGKISAILGQATPGSSNFTVKVVLADPQGLLLTGLPVTATIALTPVSGILIPRASFTDANEAQVIVVRDHRAYHVPVHVVREDATSAIVTGISLQTTLVDGGDDTLTDGQEIQAS